MIASGGVGSQSIKMERNSGGDLEFLFLLFKSYEMFS